jgi:CubicO group peptidase (beta-lactamase class C family)
MKPLHTLRLIIVAALLLAASAYAQNAPDIAGVWEGTITLPGMPLGVTLEFTKADDGTYAGKIDIPLQGAKGLPLANIAVTGNAASFEIAGVPGEPRFVGTLTDDGKTIAGNLTQGGGVFPFSIQRQDAAKAAAAEGALKEKLDRLRVVVDSLRKVWKVPGVGLGIVKDDQVILSEGFGQRNVTGNLPVTAQTLFAIGSCTKAFTTAALGILADEGKIDWDKPVKDYLPTFKMHDDFASQRMTVTDLITHRSGLPRHDFMWYNSSFSRKDIFDRLQYLEPNKDFRTDWQYQNIMYMTAGYLLEQVSGGTWESFVRSRIFEPLGMKASNFSVDESQKAPDFASPYREVKDTVKLIPFRNITTAGPAGSINSSVNEMLEWTRLHLNQGKAGDKQLLNTATAIKLHTPAMVMPQSVKYDEVLGRAYALGWMTSVYRGHQVVDHGGSIDGFLSEVMLLPSDNLGIVVLTNLDGTPLTNIIARYVTDVLLGLDPVDWSGRIKAQVDAAKVSEEKSAKDVSDRKPNTKPSHPLTDFTGEYENPGYGVLTVKLVGKSLETTYNNITAQLEHWHYDVFRARSEELEDLKLYANFMTNNSGDIDRVSIPLEPNAKEIVFVRIPPSNLRDPQYLKKFVGEYVIETQVSTISLKGDSVLTLYVPGQPTYDLLPYKGTEFMISGLTGFSVVFTVDKSGVATEAVFHQPNGIFAAKRVK